MIYAIIIRKINNNKVLIMKIGMFITFILSFVAVLYFGHTTTGLAKEIDGVMYYGTAIFNPLVKVLCAGTIVSGIIFFSILLSGAESDDFDGDHC